MSLEDRGDVAQEKARRARNRMNLAVFGRVRLAGLLIVWVINKDEFGRLAVALEGSAHRRRRETMALFAVLVVILSFPCRSLQYAPISTTPDAPFCRQRMCRADI